jgi:hypothetical protein
MKHGIFEPDLASNIPFYYLVNPFWLRRLMGCSWNVAGWFLRYRGVMPGHQE